MNSTLPSFVILRLPRAFWAAGRVRLNAWRMPPGIPSIWRSAVSTPASWWSVQPFRLQFGTASHPIALVLLAGCPHAGTQPHDMGAASHEGEASEADAAAAAHAAQYDPAAVEATRRCHSGKGGRICWTRVTNPTDEHLREAEAMAKVAAEHRSASVALLAAEESACAGIAAEDRDVSPFAYTEDIAGVEPLTVSRGGGKLPRSEVTMGAVVTVRAVPGLTAEWLQRVVDCHVARDASLGHVVPEMPDCPLVPKGVSAKVTSTGTGFAVEIRADDPDAAADVLARARRLVASPEAR